MNQTFFLYTDGASRSNPGDCGIGYVLYNQNKDIIMKNGYFIGYGTNNYAEYMAVIIASLIHFDLFKNNKVILYADSLLLINQLKKEWKIKDLLLKKCNGILLRMQENFIIEPHHIPRELNQHADEIANQGIDNKKILPETITEMLLHDLS